MCSRNLRVFVNFPKHVPRDTRFSRATLEACMDNSKWIFVHKINFHIVPTCFMIFSDT